MRVRLAALAIGISSTIAGIALIYAPAALIVGGVGVAYAALFFDDGKK